MVLPRVNWCTTVRCRHTMASVKSFGCQSATSLSTSVAPVSSEFTKTRSLQNTSFEFLTRDFRSSEA